MAGPIPSVPKSICKSLASSAKNYFDRNINYAQPCPVYRSEIELTDLRTHVSASLALHYSNAFAAASIILFTPKNVNDFLKKIHKKANTSPEEESKEKELTRLSNVAAKLRKERAAVEKLEEDAARALRLEQLNRQADTADTVLARALQWVSLLFTQSGVALEGIVLLTSDENNLDVLKTDIDDIFNQLRGEASILSPRCLAIVLELERIMTLLRSHTCIQHMAPFLTPRHTGHAIVPSVVAPPKKHRGTTLGSKKWRNGDAQESRKGGIKFINLSVRNRADKLDKKANALLDLVAARAVEEEEILKKRTLKTPRRKSLMLSKEDAKKESLCPTKMQEKTDEQVEGTFMYCFYNKIAIPYNMYNKNDDTIIRCKQF